MSLPVVLPHGCSSYLPWHRVAVITFLLVSLCIVYYYFVPFFTVSSSFLSANFSSSHHSQTVNFSRHGLPVSNGSTSYTVKRGAVLFRNAPWKADVGLWLTRCYEDSVLSVDETIYNRPCPNDCSRQGVCNLAEGQCRCFHGYGGLGCEDTLNLECNLGTLPEWPYGPWVVSICSAYCDKRRAMCFCGNGTRYPERPVAEACGFVPRPSSMRKTLFYFNGNLGNAYEHGRPEPNYSMGIRQKLALEFGSSPNKEGKLGRQATKDVMVTNIRSFRYFEELASSKFCGVLPGDGWSGRMEDSIMHGCIPVIVQDGIQLIYKNVLDYDSFAVRIAEEDIPQLVQILRVLHYKLYNDAWRLELLDQHKQHNFPKGCKIR